MRLASILLAVLVSTFALPTQKIVIDRSAAPAASGRGERVMNRERIPHDEYGARYAENFRAENYDPRA